jgi:phospholipid transport system transporter-binding protein
VIRREGTTLIVEGPVTLYTASALFEAAEPEFAQGVVAVDFRAVTEVDSAAVALALDWCRQAQRRNAALKLENLPAAMENLARLYGVSDLLRPALH